VQGLLRRRPASLDPEATAARLRSMNRQLVHMADLLDRLFEIGRGDDEALELDPGETDLVEVVAEVGDRYAEDLAWARCPLTLVLPTEPVVGEWDRMRLDQAITNLISNAMKYGRGAPITIELTATREHAALKVADGGQGIARADLPRIFEKYARCDKRRTITGLGLGLWIVKRIVERSGGTIQVESEVGEGSTFTLILPRSPLNRP
jgi:signal transduction histidine kinase